MPVTKIFVGLTVRLSIDPRMVLLVLHPSPFTTASVPSILQLIRGGSTAWTGERISVHLNTGKKMIMHT